MGRLARMATGDGGGMTEVRGTDPTRGVVPYSPPPPPPPPVALPAGGLAAQMGSDGRAVVTPANPMLPRGTAPLPPIHTGGGSLRRGGQGSGVKALQANLNAAAVGGSVLKEDGRFGKATDEALRAFQGQAGLEVDGVAGPNTKSALEAGRLMLEATQAMASGNSEGQAQAHQGLQAAGKLLEALPSDQGQAMKAKWKAAAEQAGLKPSSGTPEETAPTAEGSTEVPGNAEVRPLGATLDGLTLRATEGRATTFANGHVAYKGKSDKDNRQNGGIGAWGDKNLPTDYFAAVPDALGLSVKEAKAWHNKKIMVTNPETGQSVVVRIQDKGPHPKTGAKVDLSPVALEAIGGETWGSLKRVQFQFVNQDAPVGPVKR